ncbi:iron-sulfur cluster co-chaperone protein HscB isoform X1 [Gouania willdenowi]|uniref:Iron-sulfur cluster co-chaperone protein HscB n=1 Tax=Gouania willdenowi TaxID=441366 RepID=A0A8C5N759_GOUWI|nr:iron-sulfur cluster co-chaperone protein HscB isoform X1 [Gouania willdenowi]
MFSVKYLRIVCLSRAAPHSHWPKASRLSVCKPVLSSSHCFTTNTLQNSTVDFTAPGKQSELCFCFNQVFRNCSTCQVKVNCWNCKQVLDKELTFFCRSCKVVQPSDDGTTFFKIMDCDHSFTVDVQKLQRRYLQLQRSLHPDNFSQKSAREQEYSESQSALVNKAYTTLLKPLSRGLYMLELEGMGIDEGTESGADSDFLMELMEINEALHEAQTPDEASKIGHDMKARLVELTEQIDTALQKGELQAAKALLAQMKYYTNIEEKVKEKLSEFM